MAKDDETTTDNSQQGNSVFNREAFLSQIKGEANKKKREALKGQVSGLLAKREEATKAVAVIDKEIDDMISRFEQGLA